MGRNYESPPLIEALCEFRFDNKQWEMTTPGLFYQEIRSRFPKKREQNVVEMQLSEGPQPKQEIHGVTTPRIQFFNEDETLLLQIGPGRLIVNCLQPYPKWPDFKKLIFDTFAHYKKVTSVARLERIGLRYINRINLPTEGNTRTYLNYFPSLPEALTDDSKNFLLRTEIDFEQSNGKLILTLATVTPDEDSRRPLLLDLDFVSIDTQGFAEEAIKTWVEKAHDNIEAAFEAIISDSLRVSFKEVE